MLQGIGAVMQVAYVVDDVYEAAERWARTLSVGPFFIQEHVQYRELSHRGRSTEADVSLAFAFSGDLQIELVQQHNAAPSVYREFLDRGGAGVQHLGALSDDLEADLARMAAMGFEVIQRGISATGTETIYFDTEARLGSMFEIIGTSDALRVAFAAMKDAAARWDGGPSAITSGR